MSQRSGSSPCVRHIKEIICIGLACYVLIRTTPPACKAVRLASARCRIFPRSIEAKSTCCRMANSRTWHPEGRCSIDEVKKAKWRSGLLQCAIQNMYALRDEAKWASEMAAEYTTYADPKVAVFLPFLTKYPFQTPVLARGLYCRGCFRDAEATILSASTQDVDTGVLGDFF